jgi:hypothetical protein
MKSWEVSGLYRGRWRDWARENSNISQSGLLEGVEKWRRFQNIRSGEQEIVLFRAKRENG